MPKAWSTAWMRRASTMCRRSCSRRASTPMWCVSSACRSMTSIGTNGPTCWSVCTTPSTRSTSPSSASISICRTPTCLSPRPSRPAALPTGPRSTSSGLRPIVAKPTEGAAAALDNVDGIVIPGGFGIRGIDGKIGAPKFARETKLPALGLCLGLQSMVIESRHVLGIEDANSSEFEPDCANPVIATMEEQRTSWPARATWATPCVLALPGGAELEEGSLVAELYGTTHVPSVTATVTKSTWPRAIVRAKAACASPGQSPDGELTGVRGTAAGRAPVLCGHPGLTRSSSPARPSCTRCSPAWSRPRSTIRRRADALSCRA